MSDSVLRDLRKRALSGDESAFDAWEREMFRRGTPAPRAQVILEAVLTPGPNPFFTWGDIMPIKIQAPPLCWAEIKVGAVDRVVGLLVTLEQGESETILRFRETSKVNGPLPTCSVCLASDHIGVDCPNDHGPESFRGSDYEESERERERGP